MKKILLIFVIFVFSLFSADINETILNGNSELYSEMLKKIQHCKKVNDEVNLQKTLLLKLLKPINELSVEEKFDVATDEESYNKLFLYYIDRLNMLKTLHSNIEADEEKSDTLSLQIKAADKALLTTQLFYAFYMKKHKYEIAKLKELENEIANIEIKLVESLKNISFNVESIKENEKKYNKEISSLAKRLEQLIIKRERYKLLEEEKLFNDVSNTIELLQNKEKILYQKLFSLIFLDFSAAVKNRDESVIQIHQRLLELFEKHIHSDKSIVQALDNLLSKMEQNVLGKVETFKAKGKQEIQREIENIWAILNQTLFTINKTPVSSLKLLFSIFIFIFGFLLGNLYKRYIKSLSLKNTTMSASTHTLLANMGYYVIFLITFFIVLKVLGIDLSSIALVAGALSVGIGFGLQNVISNFVSGIILMVERSVKIGDYIELDNDLRGHVIDIKMRSITVNTNSNIDIIVPNQDLIQNRVINWTMNDKIRRFEIPFGVAYGTPSQKVIDVILEAVEKSGFDDLYNTPERHTRVIMTGMGNSSVDFELFVWIKGKEILFPKRTTSRFLVLIYNTLYDNGIEIPFPQQDIHIRSVTPDFSL